MMKKIKTLLIANRGEIACRIIKTAKRLNLKTIAIYATPDVNALHCQMADEAYCVGDVPVEKSYLNMDKIISVAKQAHADAIHPGYGFLSENAQFSDMCEKNGFIFVGPGSDAIAKMAVKDEAKAIMIKAKVPCVPGYMGKVQDNNTLSKAATDIGYPIMLKAAKGGGGKGMRVVHQPSELLDAIEASKRESMSSFGDDTLFIEKYLTTSRHIEVQIFRDNFGNCVHLFERDCSLQRRHQKIIEESPATDIPASVKQALFQAAIDAANAIDYRGAGTIEFLYDNQQNFYFMEMNTRLQVEHPVTEMITRLDLVEWQLLVADGQALPLQQQDIHSQGHAIEARIYAEDPYHQFLPASGTIKDILLPSGNYRLDSGIKVGDNINIYFDPILAKLIVHASTREQAILKLQHALNEYHLIGLSTNLPFLRNIIKDSVFLSGKGHTQYVESHLETLLPKPDSPTPFELAMIGMIQVHKRAQQVRQVDEPNSPWNHLKAWRVNLPFEETFTLQYLNEDIIYRVLHPKQPDGYYYLEILNTPIALNIKTTLVNNRINAMFDSLEMNAYFYSDEHNIDLFHEGKSLAFKPKTYDSHSSSDGPNHALIAPMPGVISKIWVKAGEKVEKGTKLVALEAMKMEHTVFSPSDGLIKSIHYEIGDQVDEGCELIDFE